MEAPSQITVPIIRPIKYRRKNITINQQNLPQYQIHYPKNLKTIYYPPSNFQDQSKQPVKEFAKILQTQDLISSANYSLNKKTAFQNSFFSSKLRHLSTSLSSFQLDAFDELNYQNSKTLFKSLTSLRTLQSFDIWFMFCQFPTTKDLRSLFNRIAYFKKMKHFSFYPGLSTGFELQHWNALCSSLMRSPQLQDLNLTFNGGDKFLEILIPVLSKLASLAKIYLSLEGDHSIQAENITKLFLALSGIKTLTDITLRLTPCRIANEKSSTSEPFTEGLQHLNASSIRKLSLDFYKNLTDKSLVKMSQTLSKFKILGTLRIGLPDSQEINDEGLAHLCSTIRELTPLTSLGLCLPGFSQGLALALKSHPNLVDLSLNFQNPNPSYDQIQELSSSLKALKPTLKLLYIKFARKNTLSDLMIENLAEALEELSLLKTLSLILLLPSNITFKGVEIFSGVIQKLSNLSCLYLILEDFPDLKKPEKAIIVPSIDQTNSERNALQDLFAILCEMKNLYRLQMRLPANRGSPLEMAKFKQRFNPRISEIESYLEIMTL